MLRGILNTDGASRGNPGPSGMGFTLDLDDGRSYHGGCFIGEVSNNVAEYSALIWGLDNARAAGVTHLEVLADSELMVKQLNGEYKVKNMGLKPLFAQAMSMLAGFKEATVRHVYRSNNSLADGLANEGIDKHGKVGSFIKHPSISQSLFEMPASDAGTRREVIYESKVMAAAAAEAAEEKAYQDALAAEREAKNEATEQESDDFSWADPAEPEDDALVAPDFKAVEPAQGAQEAIVFDASDAALAPVPPKNIREGSAPQRIFDTQPIEPHGVYELTVKEHFDAAHALVGYPGKCRNLHGHTWDVEVSVEGTQLDEVGILYDFKALKTDLLEILDQFDHKFLNEVEPFTQMNSTAENLARVIFEQMEERLPAHVTLTEVCVWESPIARLRYRKVH
ncbi:MAG: 6-carboxytetrahydropterin synthase QueD [Coriobacteriales bacterium]|nr:6-carboxytetrahydropterin synthase QueD [Coriobacteriales bacterium]